MGDECMKWVFSVMLCLVLFLNAAVPTAALSVSARGAVLINGATGEVLWQQNMSEPLSMASTTKIMTALLLCESGELDREITVTSEMVTIEGSSMGLLPGDTVSYRDLLYGMLLASGNDAANTVALSLADSAENFALMMNAKAAEIGMENTHFVTASGLDSAGHSSTAYDMALLARYALENKDFKEACSAKYATLCYGNPPYKRTLKNHNKLLWNYEGAIGVKTGYTKKSGRCLVSAAERDGKYLISVTLSAPSDWADHAAMLDFGFSLLRPRVLSGERISLPVISGTEGEITVTSEPINIALSDSEYNSLEKYIFLPKFCYAGIKSGEQLGRVEYKLNGKTVATAPLKAESDIPYEGADRAVHKIFSNFKKLIKAMV